MFKNISASGNGVPRKRGVYTPPRYPVHPSSATVGGNKKNERGGTILGISYCPIMHDQCVQYSAKFDEESGETAECVFTTDDGDCFVMSALFAITQLGEAVHGGWGKNETPPHIFVQSDTSITGEINTY